MKKITLLMCAACFALGANAADKYVTVSTGGADTEGSFQNVMSTITSGDIIRFNIPGTDEVVVEGSSSFPSVGSAVYVIEGKNEATGNKITLKSDGEVHRCLGGLAANSNKSTVTIRNVNFEDFINNGNGGAISFGNSALGGAGESEWATVTMENCMFKNCKVQFENNPTSGGGGAIMNSRGILYVFINTAFVDNAVDFQDGMEASAGGGAISTTSTDGGFVFINTTFYGNKTNGGGRGGAVFLGHKATVINSTFVNNQAGYRCGGFYFHNNNPCNIANSIFTHNISPDADRADLRADNGTFKIYNSIAGQATSTAEAENDRGLNWGINNNQRYTGMENLFEGGDNPVLKDNGGSTLTVALINRSIAAAKGLSFTTEFGNYGIPTVDQRGAPRPSNNPCIGAFEYGAEPPSSMNEFSPKNLTVYGAQNKIIVISETPGICTVYSETGITLYEESIDATDTLHKYFIPGFYIVKFTANDGSISSSAKVVIR